MRLFSSATATRKKDVKYITEHACPSPTLLDLPYILLDLDSIVVKSYTAY